MSNNRKNAEAIYDLIKSHEIDANFTEDEKINLIRHAKNDDLNQFYLVIVSKAIASKTFTESHEKLIPYLISKLADSNVNQKNPDDNEGIIKLAELTFKTLYFIDFEKILKTDFWSNNKKNVKK